MPEQFELWDYYHRVGYDGHCGPYGSYDSAVEAAKSRLHGSRSLEMVTIHSRQTDTHVAHVYRDRVVEL